MLVQYTAEKGLKLYGDEVFCMAATPVANARNHFKNGDLRYGTEFWIGGADTTVSIANGRLRFTNNAGGNVASVNQAVAVVSATKYHVRVSIPDSTSGLVALVWADVARSVLLGSKSGLINTGVYGVEFTATSDSVFVEFVADSGGSGTYAEIYDMVLSEVTSTGVAWQNLLVNSFFGVDVSEWTEGNSAVLTWNNGSMVVTNGAALFGYAYDTFAAEAGAFYRLSYKFIQLSSIVGIIRAGTSAIGGQLGDAGNMASSREGSFVFRSASAVDAYISLIINTTVVSDATEWDNVVAYKVNDILVDGEFLTTTGNTSWLGAAWAFGSGAGKATITGNTGERLTQDQADALTVGETYMYVFELVIPSESLRVAVHNILLGSDVASVTYTASGVYSILFTAEDTDVRLVFESVATSAALEVKNVRGGLAVVNPDGSGSFVDGEVLLTGAASHTDTGLVSTQNSINRDESQTVVDAYVTRVLSDQNVGTGDFTYVGHGYYGGEGSDNAFFFIKANDVYGGYNGEPAILGSFLPGGFIRFQISDDGMVTEDSVRSLSAVPVGPFFWELVRSGTKVFIRINSAVTSSSVTLTNAVASLDNANGYNYAGQFRSPEWAAGGSAADNSWQAVGYGNGLFVAVSYTGTGNRVMTSPDGITWTIRTSAADNAWYQVAFGDGLFVAVSYTGTGDRVMTSPDGITWTIRTSAADNLWYGVTYGNDLFVAVAGSGTGNRVMTSPDGITWTIRTSAADNNWTDVTYGNGLFVAVSNSGTGNRVMTSPDGINWTIRTSAADNAWLGVVYGGGRFVAVSSSGTGNRVMTSPDGITWTIRTSAADNSWSSVAFGDGLFVAVSYTGTGDRAMISTDGVDWYLMSSPVDSVWNGVVYGSGLFVAASSSGTGNRAMVVKVSNIRLLSPWGLREVPIANQWAAVIYGGGQFVAVAPGAFTGQRVMTSPDGIDWTYRVTGPNNQWYGVAYGGGIYVAVSDSGSLDRVMTSPDGITWTSRTTPDDNNWRDVVYGNGLFVAVSYTGTGNRVMTSPDGITWTSRTSAADNDWVSVTFGNSLFVAVSITGTGNRVMTSPDGINWTIRTSAADNAWRGVTYGHELFVAVSDTGTGDRIMTSPNGIDWTSRTNPVDNSWGSVTYGTGLYVAVSATGTGNRVMTSLDGVNWEGGISAADYIWRGVAYGNGTFAAVGASGIDGQVMSVSADLLSDVPGAAHHGSSLVRFIPSATSRSRSRATYASEKQLFLPDTKYTQNGALTDLVVDSPTAIETSNDMQGATFVPDDGTKQETTVQRLDMILNAASKELDYYEAIEFRAFLESVVRGREFTYDPYAVDAENFTNPYQVFLRQSSFTKARQNKLEYFMYNWAMRVKGSQ